VAPAEAHAVKNKALIILCFGIGRPYPGGVIDSATHRRDRASIRWGFFTNTSKLSLLVWAIPCCIAVAYLVVFLLRFSHNVWLIGWTSDYAFGFVAPQSVVSTGIGDYVNLSTYGSYVPLWFGLLTAWLPFHRELWQVAPTALFAIAALTVGWSVAQLANRRAAALAVLLALIASPAAWGIFMAPAAHNMTYPCTALVGAYLVWLAKEGSERRRAVRLGAPLLLALVLGTSFASDNLLVPTAILPLALTALLAGVRRDRRSRQVALSAFTTAVAAVPIAWLTSKSMRALGYQTEKQPLDRAPLSAIPTHARELFDGLKNLFNGNLGPAAPGAMHSALGLACDVFMLLALATLLGAALRAVVNCLLPARRAGRSPHPERLPRDLHCIYWASSAAGACGAYVASNFFDSLHEAFYATTILSIAAVIPLFVSIRNPARWLIPIGSAIFFAASLASFSDYYVGSLYTRLAADQSTILKLAQANHVTVGYTGYWGATSLTWNSHERVKLRPVHWCPEEEGHALCRFPHDTVGSWYVPKARHTFLIVEPNEFASTSITVLPSGLGRPLAAYQLGPVQMYVYPYDIASKVGSPFGAQEAYYRARGL
jgi:hypothetical protein